MKIRTCSFLAACLLCLCLAGCKTSKKSQARSQELVNLKHAVELLVKCLNTRDEACVLERYASDFESYSPLIEFSSVAQLVEKTIANFENNKFQVAINILDLSAGAELGYVVLEWELMEQRADGAWLSLLLEKRMDIWKKDARLGWQLHRSLFYKPRFY